MAQSWTRGSQIEAFLKKHTYEKKYSAKKVPKEIRRLIQRLIKKQFTFYERLVLNLESNIYQSTHAVV